MNNSYITNNSEHPVSSCILVDDKQGAALLSVSISGFQRLGLPRVRLARRLVRTRLEDINALIAKRMVESRGNLSRKLKQGVKHENLLG